MTTLLLLTAGAFSWQTDATSNRDQQIKDARQVLAAILQAARQNQSQALPLRGDDLTQEYIRSAAHAAAKLPQKQAGAAFSLALGVALDSSRLMRLNPVVALTWRRVESEEERQARLKVLGTPTVHGRHDLAQHFAVSLALTAVLGEKRAESAGLLKELLDAAEGGSGFSFADLAANYAGIALAREVISRPDLLPQIAKHFQISDFILPPKGFPEGLSRQEFDKRYGSTSDAKFLQKRDEIVKRTAALPGYRPRKGRDAKP